MNFLSARRSSSPLTPASESETVDAERRWSNPRSPARVPKHRPLIGLVDPQEHLRETVHLIVVTPLRKGEIKLRKSLAIVHSALIAADL